MIITMTRRGAGFYIGCVCLGWWISRTRIPPDGNNRCISEIQYCARRAAMKEFVSWPGSEQHLDRGNPRVSARRNHVGCSDSRTR